MKKIYLLCLALLAYGAGFAQTEMLVSETGGVNDPIVYVDSNYQYTPCGLNGESNAFENGKSCTRNYGRMVAHDLTFPSDQNLMLESITANVFLGGAGSGVYAEFVDIFLFEDDGGSPGTVITGTIDFIPTSQDVVGSNFGFDIWQLELDITDYMLYGGSGSTTTYWIGLSIEATDGSNNFWENSTLGLIGFGEAYDDGVGGGFVISPELEGVYTFTGDCVPRILGVDDNLAERLVVHPNPATNGKVTIETGFPGEKQVIVFDVLGKKMIDTVITNTELDVSGLYGGLYLFRVTQKDETATIKLIVN